MAPIYIGLFIIALVGVSLVPKRMFGLWGDGWLYVVLFRLGLTYVILLVGSIFSDIVRLQATLYPERTLRFWIGESLNYLGRRIVQTGGVYLIYAIPMLAVWLLIERFALVATGGLQNVGGVLIELVLFQVCSLLRTGQSLLFVATLAPMTVAHAAGRSVGRSNPEESHD